MAKNNSRSYQISRRGEGIGDLSALTDITGTVDPSTDAFIRKICRNNISNVGIGTESEVGLEIQRYAIRVVHESLAALDDRATTAIKTWAVVDAQGTPIQFSRRPPVEEIMIRNLYLACGELDSLLDESHKNSATAVLTPHAASVADIGLLRDHCRRVNHDAAQLTDMGRLIAKINTDCTAAKVPICFQIGGNAYLVGRRHGRDMFPVGVTRAVYDATKVGEMMACFALNYRRFMVDYPTLATGIKVLCAYTMSWMFMNGLQEMYEGKEYITVVVSGADPKKYIIKEVRAVEGYVVPPTLVVNSVIDTTTIRINKTVMELGPALCIMAGINHYSFNHTTGGMKVSGPMLTALMMYKFINVDPAANVEEEQTRLLYETLHPVNKRGIANMFFKDCHVYTWGRIQNACYMKSIGLDAFLTIRAKPTPAGAHKAYLAGLVLQKVLSYKLNVFLPWADQIENCVTIISDIIRQGARSHVGAAYYTGSSSATQGSSLDAFMPELAQFVQIMAARDTLAMSPHLGPDVAARSGTTWTNLLKNIRNKDLTAVSAQTVQEFLTATGSFTSQFDEKDKTTWTAAAADSKRQADILQTLMQG